MYRVDNAKVTERIIEQIKQNEMLDKITDKAYIEYLKNENKFLRDIIEYLENENKQLKELIEVRKNIWEIDYGI